MIYIKLLLTFLKIGLFSFGGGYAMIPMIEKEIEGNGWLSASEFFDIVAIAEMTPGPIAVNSATFVGYKTAGFLGGLTATIGVVIPSLVLILIISRFFFKFQKHPLNTAVFYGVRPVIAGLIATAAIFVSETAIFKGKLTTNLILKLFRHPLDIINVGSIFIFAVSLIALRRTKLHPILVIALSGALGILIFYVL
ncbi:MAG: chromate transporter [Clostridiales bacterium]|nr:chromate transporter [Clostridiales bacterium]